MSFSKAGLVAAREFIATVSTRGFIIGLLLVPAMLAFVFMVVPKIMNQRGRAVEGQVLLVDRSGRVADQLTRELTADAIAARRAAAARQAEAALPPSVRGIAGDAVQRSLGEVPVLHIVPQSGTTSVDEAKRWLLDRAALPPRLAVIIVQPDALDRRDSGEYGGYDLYVPVNADSRLEGTIYDGVREALVNVRARDQGQNASALQDMVRVTRARSTTVTENGERTTDLAFARTLPYIFIGLMFMGVMIGGQGLMTTTIEEKSSRVVEVMLAAVSPLELMIGKLVGQLGVGLLALAVYLGLGVMVLTSMAMLGLVDVTLIIYLMAFFAVQYILTGAFMIAVGSAVNDLREAQSLMTPVSIMLMLPWFLATPILQNPTSTFALVMSFIPPVNTFAMLLRLSSTAPPPAWQAWLTIVIGLAAAGAVTMAAAKVYRIGLLMYGKPPNFATLWRWVRAA
jgi:ABC-type Na+ efflux pump permease subunit